MDPYNEIDRGRLFKAIENSYRALSPFRDLVRGLVEEYVGPGYGRSDRPRHEIIVNLMNQAVDAYTMALVANRPRVLLSTKREDLNYFSKQFELATNNLIEEICLEETLKRQVLDAFFCVGIVKVHMADSGQVMLEEGTWMDPGTPYASNVSLDNWVHDSSAKSFSEVKFAGDAYRIPFEDLKSDIYDQDRVEEARPTTKATGSDGERLEKISQGDEVDADEFEPMVDLIDVWIPRNGKIYTFILSNASLMQCKGPPVACMDWTGAEFGPYHLLGFNEVPENILPASPASQLASLSRLVNNLYRKQSKRARSQKRLHTYTSGGAGDAKRLQKSVDDEWVMVENAKEVGEVNIGGVDPNAQAFLVGATQDFDRMAGNLTAMLGLGAQADTASQENLIHGAVSKKEAQMLYRVMGNAKRIIRDLGYMLWHDQMKVIPGQLPIEGAEGYSADATWTPEDREGDFLDYNFDIDVYSMPYQSPGQRVNALTTLLSQVYAPMAQMLVQQGGQINLQRLTEIYADLMNEPRLTQIVQFAAAPMEQQPGPPQGGGASPASTTRNYVRRSIPTGGTAQGRAHVQQQSWLNGAVNDSQRSSLTLPGA